MTVADLLAEINAFLARQCARPGVRMTETTFGRLAVNDGKFVGRLRDGKGITLDTLEKVRGFISKYEGHGTRGRKRKQRESGRRNHSPSRRRRAS